MAMKVLVKQVSLLPSLESLEASWVDTRKALFKPSFIGYRNLVEWSLQKYTARCMQPIAQASKLASLIVSIEEDPSMRFVREGTGWQKGPTVVAHSSTPGPIRRVDSVMTSAETYPTAELKAS